MNDLNVVFRGGRAELTGLEVVTGCNWGQAGAGWLPDDTSQYQLSV